MDESTRRRRAIVVVDMLVGFCRHGALCSPRYDPLVARLRTYLAAAEAEGVPLVFLVDTHAPDDPEFKMFPPHCVKGSGEDEVVAELKELADRGTVVRKHTFSGFQDTELDAVLERLAPEVIEVAGVCTDICVVYAVYDLRMRGYEVVVHADLVETYDAPGHDAEELDRRALAHIRDVLGASVE
ncbi:MAG: isochorismatase family cysteine hydrolase [Actinomycetes bacterium]